MTRQFDALKAFVHAVKSIWKNRWPMLLMTWPWMLVLLPFDYMRVFYAMPVVAGLKPGDTPTPEQAATFLQYIIPFYLVAALSLASLAVIWHRYILRDEWPRGLQLLRIDRTVMRYLGNLIMMTLLVAFALIIPMLLVTVIGSSIPVLSGFGFGLVVMFATALSFRLGLKFPAIAIENRAYRFADALTQTKGSFGSIIFYSFMVVLTVMVGGLILDHVLRLISATAEFGFLLSYGYQWITTMFGITALTTLYGFFEEKRSY